MVLDLFDIWVSDYGKKFISCGVVSLMVCFSSCDSLEGQGSRPGSLKGSFYIRRSKVLCLIRRSKVLCLIRRSKGLCPVCRRENRYPIYRTLRNLIRRQTIRQRRRRQLGIFLVRPINIETAWAITRGSPDVIVAIIDDNFCPSHLRLWGAQNILTISILFLA